MVTGDQVDVEVENFASLENLDIICIVFELISSAKEGIALVVGVGFLYSVLYRASDV